MPYALFKPRSTYSSLRPDRLSTAPRPKYTTNDRAVAQVFHAYGWVVIHVQLPTLDLSEEEDTDDWDSDLDDEDDDYYENDCEEDFPATATRCSGLVELHHTDVMLEPSVFYGPQVREQLKLWVMYVADWTEDKEVDLRYAW